MKQEQRDRIIVGTVICGGAFLFVVAVVILAWRYGCYAVICCRCCERGSLYKTDADAPSPAHPRRSFGGNVLDGEVITDKDDVVAVRVESSSTITPDHSFSPGAVEQVP